MRPFTLFLPDPTLPDIAYGTLGKAIAAGHYRYEGYFETRSDDRAAALAALPRIANALWVDHVDGGGVHRVGKDGDLVYEGDLPDLLGYSGILTDAADDTPLRLRFECGHIPMVTSALDGGVLGETLKRGLRDRLEAGDTVAVTRSGLVRTLIGLTAGLNDGRRTLETDLTITDLLKGITRVMEAEPARRHYA